VAIGWFEQSASAEASLVVVVVMVVVVVVVVVVATGVASEVTQSIGGALDMSRSSGVKLDVVSKSLSVLLPVIEGEPIAASQLFMNPCVAFGCCKRVMPTLVRIAKNQFKVSTASRNLHQSGTKAT